MPNLSYINGILSNLSLLFHEGEIFIAPSLISPVCHFRISKTDKCDRSLPVLRPPSLPRTAFNTLDVLTSPFTTRLAFLLKPVERLTRSGRVIFFYKLMFGDVHSAVSAAS